MIGGLMERVGRTTKQIKKAPFKAFYGVSSFQDVLYTERLSADLGRLDLRVVVLNENTDFHRFRATRKRIVVDHYVAGMLSGRVHDSIRIHNAYVEKTSLTSWPDGVPC